MYTKKEIKRDFYFGIGIICFALFFIISAYYTIDNRSGIFISGRSFPYFIGCILLILGFSLLYSRAKQLKATHIDEEEENTFTKAQVKRIAQYIAILILYALGMLYIGYIVSTAILCMTLMKFTGAENKLSILLYGCITPVAMWYVFSVLMEVQFPQALLF